MNYRMLAPRKEAKQLNGNLEVPDWRASYSVEKIIRDYVAVVFQRKRIQAASMAKSYSHYPADRDDKRLSYKITVKRAYEGMIALGYLQEVKKGFFDRTFSIGRPSKSALTRYEATSKLIDLFSEQEQKCLPSHNMQEVICRYRRIEVFKRALFGLYKSVEHAHNETFSFRF